MLCTQAHLHSIRRSQMLAEYYYCEFHWPNVGPAYGECHSLKDESIMNLKLNLYRNFIYIPAQSHGSHPNSDRLAKLDKLIPIRCNEILCSSSVSKWNVHLIKSDLNCEHTISFTACVPRLIKNVFHFACNWIHNQNGASVWYFFPHQHITTQVRNTHWR